MIVNVLFCTLKRAKGLASSSRALRLGYLYLYLRISLISSIVFHLSFVLVFIGVVYNQFFYFEGVIRFTEGETLSCSDEQNYDWLRKGRFFRTTNLAHLGELYLHKFYPFYYSGGSFKGQANRVALLKEGENKEAFIYVNHPLKHRGFEFYRDQDGISPLFVFRDNQGRVLTGSYAPFHAVKLADESYNYAGGFPFPQENPFFAVWSVYFPEKKEERAKVFLEIRDSRGRELSKGKASLKEMVAVGDFFVSVDEIRYWSKFKVKYRPGLPLIFTGFWTTLGALSLTMISKVMRS